MTAEMIDMVEDYDWESDEAEDWESDEAFDESEDGAEDIGERARRRRRQSRYYRPGRGVRGIMVRRPNGMVSRMPFPAPLATAADTNRELAKQELARRALTERLNRLETRARTLQKKDSSVSGLVTLAIGGGLAGYGAIQAVKGTGKPGLQGWAEQTSTRTAAVVSAAQLATSGAKLVINGRYHRSGIGIAADIYSATQLVVFAYGSLGTPKKADDVVDDYAAAKAKLANYKEGYIVETLATGIRYRVVTRNGSNEFDIVR